MCSLHMDKPKFYETKDEYITYYLHVYHATLILPCDGSFARVFKETFCVVKKSSSGQVFI